MDNLNDLLNKKVGKSAFRRKLDATSVCEVAREFLGKDGRPISFCRGILLVGVKDSYVANKIFFNSSRIIDSVNQKLGKEEMKGMRFRVEEA